MQLTTGQKEQFDEQGYLLVPNVMTTGDLLPVRTEYSALLAVRVADWVRRGVLSIDAIPEADVPLEVGLANLAANPTFDPELFAELDITLPHAPFASIQPDSPFHVGPGLLALTSTSALLDIVSDVVGPEITASGNQHCRLKPPTAAPSTYNVGRSAANTAAQTPWHTDAMTQAVESDDTPILTTWIPMADVNLEDGCLLVVPGGHVSMPHVPWPIDPVSRARIEAASAPVPAKLGDIVLLHKHMPHASSPNHGNRVRWSFDLRYYNSDLPGDRPWFPSIPVRSPSGRHTVVTSGEQWRAMWEAARLRLAASGQPLPGRPDFARAVAETHLRRWAVGKYS